MSDTTPSKQDFKDHVTRLRLLRAYDELPDEKRLPLKAILENDEQVEAVMTLVDLLNDARKDEGREDDLDRKAWSVLGSLIATCVIDAPKLDVLAAQESDLVNEIRHTWLQIRDAVKIADFLGGGSDQL